MAIKQYPADRTTLKSGDPIGILYYQKNSSGIWTVGIHNGAYIRYDTQKHAYVVRHSSRVIPNTLTPRLEVIYFYRTLQDLLNDTSVPNPRKYVLIKTYYTRAQTSGSSKPAIAWVLKNSLTVHNGRFEKFVFNANYPPAILRNKFTYLNYNQLRQDYPNASALSNGNLYYSHYDFAVAGHGRLAASENSAPIKVGVVNIRRL